MGDELQQDRPGARGTALRAVLVAAAWVVAAVVAGLPAGTPPPAAAADAPRTELVSTGPECFAGHAGPPPSSEQ